MDLDCLDNNDLKWIVVYRLEGKEEKRWQYYISLFF